MPKTIFVYNRTAGIIGSLLVQYIYCSIGFIKVEFNHNRRLLSFGIKIDLFYKNNEKYEYNKFIINKIISSI